MTPWRFVYGILVACFLLAAALNLLNVRGGFLTSHLADVTVPALLYVLARELVPGKRLYPGYLARVLGRSPATAAIVLFLASSATELSQAYWPHGFFAGRFDPWDIAAFGVGLAACYAFDKGVVPGQHQTDVRIRSSFLAAAGGGALLSATFLAAQAPASSDLIRDVAVGGGTLLVKADGSVLTWGRSPGGAIPGPVVVELPGKVLKVAVGGSNTGGFTGYALLEDGTIVAWGDNDEGQLGNGPQGADLPLGTYPKASITPVQVTGLSNIIDIDAGTKHAVALGRDGTVWAWGTRDEGTLGGGDAKPARSLRVLSALAPVAVPGLEGITQIAVGGTHSLALTRDGHVMSWGTNRSGELGVGTRITGWTPARVTGLDNVVAIAAGNAAGHGVSGALRQDGTVWMWGSGASGMMGNGHGALSPDDPGGRNLLPIQVKGIVGAKGLAVGGGIVAALLGDGTLRMWGHNGFGEVGVGSARSYETVPVKVTALTSVAAVYLGNSRSYAVRSDGTFWIWGFGQSTGQGILAKNLRVPTRLDLP